MSQITVFTGPERRRQWSDEDRMRILAEAFAPGACVAEVARRSDLSTSLIYTWRRKFLGGPPRPAPSTMLGTGFAEAVVADEPQRDRAPTAAIVVDLPGGSRVSISPAAPPPLIAATLKALR